MSQFNKFSLEDAKRVISEMRIFYGKKFSDQWLGVDPKDLALKMVDMFSDLKPEDLNCGFAKMQTQAWPPTLPEFKSWCIGNLKSQWLGANEAWNIARGSIDFDGNELTVVWTKESCTAFESVISQVKLGDKYQIADAKKSYVETYERMVLDCVERGEKPVYFISSGNDREQHEIALKDAEIAGFLVKGSSSLLLEHHQTPKQAKKEADHFKTIAQEHLEKLGKLIKRNAPKIITEFDNDDEKPLLDLSKNLPEWADPFDEHEKYISGLANDKKPVPMMLRK